MVRGVGVGAPEAQSPDAYLSLSLSIYIYIYGSVSLIPVTKRDHRAKKGDPLWGVLRARSARSERSELPPSEARLSSTCN